MRYHHAIPVRNPLATRYPATCAHVSSNDAAPNAARAAVATASSSPTTRSAAMLRRRPNQTDADLRAQHEVPDGPADAESNGGEERQPAEGAHAVAAEEGLEIL